MRIKSFVSAALLLLCSTAIAQTTITVKGINKKGNPIAGASVSAINSLDSSKTVYTVADSNGIATMMVDATVSYMLEISAVN